MGTIKSFKKFIEESIWSDMQDRSVGDTVRKEDERHIYLERLLATYIKLFAESCYYHDEYAYSSYPDFISYIKDFRDNPRIEEVCPNNSYFDDLLDYVNKETWDNQIFDTIVEISQRIVHGEHPITDDVIEELRKHNVNESIWSDMQDRSAGDTVRQEDEITTNKDLRNKILELYKEQGEGETLDVSSLTNCIKCDDFSYLFSEFRKVKHIIGLEDWDVSNVKDMKVMFRNCEKFNSDLSKWDVSSVENMGFMFQGCKKFKSDLSNWNVSNVKDMYNMFCYCENFNCDLSNWDVSNVKDMCRMFDSCINFNSDLSNWDVSNVKDMNGMFDVCVNFNSDLSNWDVSNVKDMYYMFAGCINFNSDLSNWDVSSVRDMHSMFEDCENFNSDLSKWNVSKVEDMESIFNGCDSLKNKPSWYHISESFIKNHFGFLNESIWSDMQDRSSGDVVRKEDEMNDDDFLMLRETAKMFRNVVKRSGNTFWKNTCDNFIKYIERRKEEHFWTNISDEAYDKVIRFVQKNWGDCTDIQEFMDKYLSNINECDGVPGGLTPADVGGMGPAYFPGPNGEPGSGDLPSPTGIVYKQVAPFDSFIKIRKQKRKKKKFRKEDEPCVHSENPPIYSHVDDFRDYVDRTYDNIDKKK